MIFGKVMQADLKNITKKPLFILSLFGAIALALSIALMTLFYYLKSESIIYQHIYDQISSINLLKQRSLERYFNEKKVDIQALASSQTIKKIVNDPQSFADYETYLKAYLNQYSYQDLLLIDKSGEVIVTTNYPQLLSLNLTLQKFNKSDMALLFEKVKQDSSTHFSDMHLPLMDLSKPVILLATPVYVQNEVKAVLMLKLASHSVNSVLHMNVSNQKSVESYAVGKDYILRSDSSLVSELSVKNSFEDPKKFSVHTENITRALRGEKGVNLILDYRGVEVLSSYAPFNLDSHKWAIVTEVDKDEINLELLNIKHSIQRWAFFVALILFTIGYFIAKAIIEASVVKPLVDMYEKAKGFEDIINNSLNEIFIFEKLDLKFVYANAAAIKNSGYSLQELQAMRPFDLKPKYNEKEFKKLIAPLLNKTKQSLLFETIHKRKDGSIYDVQINLQLIKMEGVRKFVAIIIDITEQNQAIRDKEYYYELSSLDYLTHIYNRKMFDTLFLKELQRSQRYATDLSVIIFDIDDFKTINDTLGHAKGDEVLIEIAGSTKILLRNSDIFARWGGEEFIILLPFTKLDEATQKAESIRNMIENIYFTDIGTITCSFGVVQVDKMYDKDIVFKEVDKALYKAKNSGKNRVETI